VQRPGIRSVHLSIAPPRAGRPGSADQGDLRHAGPLGLPARSCPFAPEGWKINLKKTHRIYNKLGLQLRNKTWAYAKGVMLDFSRPTATRSSRHSTGKFGPVHRSKLVLVTGRRPGKMRGVQTRVQYAAPSQLHRQQDPTEFMKSIGASSRPMASQDGKFPHRRSSVRGRSNSTGKLYHQRSNNGERTTDPRLCSKRCPRLWLQKDERQGHSNCASLRSPGQATRPNCFPRRRLSTGLKSNDFCGD
jgi:hypothetical protein